MNLHKHRSGAFMVGAFAGTSLANYVFSLVMARMLLPEGFGVLAFAQTLLLLAGLILESGVPWSLARELATAKDDRERAASVRGAALTNLLLSLGLGATVLLLFASGAFRAGLESWAVAVAVAAALPLIAVVGVARGAAQGIEAFGVLATLQVTEGGLKALGGTVLVLFGLGTFGAVAGFALGAAVAALYGTFVLTRRLAMSVAGPRSNHGLRVAGPMFGAFFGAALLLNLDFLVLKLAHDHDRAAAGFYQAGIVLANAPYFLVTSAVVPLVFASLARLEGLAATRGMVTRALCYTAVLVVPIELALASAPRAFLTLLFPEPYAAGAEALRIRALGVALFLLVTVLSSAYQAAGRAGRVATVFLGLAVLEIALLASLARFSVTGAAAAFALTMAVGVVILGADYLRQAGSVPAKLLGWLGRYAAAIAASSIGGRVAIGIGLSPLGSLLLSATVFTALVLALGLLPPSRPAGTGTAPLRAAES